MTDETMTATKANRNFPELLRKVESGHTIQITSHGHPVAYVIPASEYHRQRSDAHQRLLDFFAQRPGRPIVAWTRDELYEDDE